MSIFSIIFSRSSVLDASTNGYKLLFQGRDPWSISGFSYSFSFLSSIKDHIDEIYGTEGTVKYLKENNIAANNSSNLTGSALYELIKASFNVPALDTPDGVLCFTITDVIS